MHYGSTSRAEFQQHKYGQQVKIKDKDSTFSTRFPLKGWYSDILIFFYLYRQRNAKSSLNIKYYTWIPIPVHFQLHGDATASIFNDRNS